MALHVARDHGLVGRDLAMGEDASVAGFLQNRGESCRGTGRKSFGSGRGVAGIRKVTFSIRTWVVSLILVLASLTITKLTLNRRSYYFYK